MCENIYKLKINYNFNGTHGYVFSKQIILF